MAKSLHSPTVTPEVVNFPTSSEAGRLRACQRGEWFKMVQADLCSLFKSRSKCLGNEFKMIQVQTARKRMKARWFEQFSLRSLQRRSSCRRPQHKAEEFAPMKLPTCRMGSLNQTDSARMKIERSEISRDFLNALPVCESH